MKIVFKAFFNDVLVIIVSFLLYFIGVLYSDDLGFYSRELLSSGGDDFDIFIGMTGINIFGIIFGSINLVINIFLIKYKNKVLNISYIIYLILFIIQLLILLLINLDTSLVFVFFTFDLFSMWFIVYIVGTFMVILSIRLIKKSDISIKIIELNIIHKLLIIVGFIVFLVLLFVININFLQFIK
jgi:hypothetical protein